MVSGSGHMRIDRHTFARFLRHSVQALGVTTPRPRRLLLAASLLDGAGCFSAVDVAWSGLLEWPDRLLGSSSIAGDLYGLWHEEWHAWPDDEGPLGCWAGI